MASRKIAGLPFGELAKFGAQAFRDKSLAFQSSVRVWNLAPAGDALYTVYVTQIETGMYLRHDELFLSYLWSTAGCFLEFKTLRVFYYFGKK
jgi:hypothetical protein